jgi:hypothetical protein
VVSVLHNFGERETTSAGLGNKVLSVFILRLTFEKEVIDCLLNLDVVRTYVAVSTFIGIYLIYLLEICVERYMPCT